MDDDDVGWHRSDRDLARYMSWRGHAFDLDVGIGHRFLRVLAAHAECFDSAIEWSQRLATGPPEQFGCLWRGEQGNADFTTARTSGFGNTAVLPGQSRCQR